MRLLWLLNLVQMACLIVLIIIVSDSEPQPAGNPPVNTPALQTNADPSDRIAWARSPNAAPAIQADQIRRIVREELAAFAAEWEQQDGSRRHTVNNTRQSGNSDPEQLAAINDTIDYYQRTENISSEQLNDLIAEIAELNEADRRAMLSRLMRSLNSGEIDGRM